MQPTPTCKKVTSIPEFIDAIRLRVDVFIRDEGFAPGWEPDDDDKTSTHYIAIIDNQIVSTARIRTTGKDEIKIERMVTKKEFRNKGIGESLIRFILKDISKMKPRPKRIWLRSQIKSQKFYEKCGFKPTTSPFDMWNVPHVDMEYENNK